MTQEMQQVPVYIFNEAEGIFAMITTYDMDEPQSHLLWTLESLITHLDEQNAGLYPYEAFDEDIGAFCRTLGHGDSLNLQKNLGVFFQYYDVPYAEVGASFQDVVDDNEMNIWVNTGVLYRYFKKTEEQIFSMTISDEDDDKIISSRPLIGVHSLLKAKDDMGVEIVKVFGYEQ
jgi:hypothetical protein